MIKPGTLIRAKEKALCYDGKEEHGPLWVVIEPTDGGMLDPHDVEAKSLATGFLWRWYEEEYEMADA